MTEQHVGIIKGNWYNGYSAAERDEKFKVLKQLIAKGILPPASGPCAICCDPQTPVEYHSEDYGKPFLWEPPAMYCLCRGCHRFKLHKRFWQHNNWQVYIAHVRRGGYSSDLKHSEIKKEMSLYRHAIEKGHKFTLRQLRPYKNTEGLEWFSNLRMDEISLTDPNARVAREDILNDKHDDV